MASSVQVVFNADTGQFQANVNAATGAVSKQAEAVANAKNTILASFKMQVQAAKEVGAGQQELEAIQRRSAQMMASVTETNANRVVSSLQRMSDKQKQVASELRNLAIPNVGHANSVSAQQQASASIRALSGSPSIRSAEAFASTVPFLNKAFEVAFPIIGAATFTAEIGRGIVALKEMYDTAQRLPNVLRDGFESINEPIIGNVDSLRKANDQLEIEIAHLEHKPANTLSLALDEARINADKLAESARKADTEVEKLLKENKVGVFQFALTGQIGTGPASDEVRKRMDEFRDLQRSNRDAVRSGSDTPQAAAARDAVIQKKLQDLYTWAHDSRTQIQSFDKDGQARANVNILEGVEDFASNTLDESLQQKRNTADQQQKQQLEDADKRRQQAAQAQRQAAETARKAMEAQRKSWEDQDDERKLSGSDSATIEVNTWAKRVAGLKQGSEQYLYAQHELAQKLAEARRQQTEQQRRDNAELKRQGDDWAELVANVARQDAEADKARNRAGVAKAQQGASYNETALSIQRETGQISRQAAAFQLAQIHAEQYRQQMAALKAELDEQQKINPFSAETINARAAVDKAAADRRVQVMQDAASTAATTWQDALKSANAVWVQDSQDSAKQVVELYQQTLNGLNDNLADVMVGDRSNFAGMFKGIGKTLANDSLKRIESPILGALGVGKADGSASNPFSVKIVGGSGTGSAGLQKLFSGSSDDSDDNSGSGIGGFFGKIGGFFTGLFGGHRALGGSVQAGVAYDVGEMGRETFVPSTNGTIIPNNRTGGNAAYYAVNVANGVTPEQMKMHVDTALRQYHSRVVGDSVAAMQEHQRRQPTSRR